MKIYIDDEYRCHVSDGDGLREVDTDFFNGKCREFIEGYRFIPAEETWVREDGATFRGGSATPVKPWVQLLTAQNQYMQDTLSAAGIRIEPKPVDLPTRPGYAWQPIQTVAGGSITWVMGAYDPELPGTEQNPIDFANGMEVMQNYNYQLYGHRKVWFGKQKARPTWDDSGWYDPEE